MIAGGRNIMMIDRIFATSSPGDKIGYATLNRTDREVRMLVQNMARRYRLRGFKTETSDDSLKVFLTKKEFITIEIINVITKEIR